MKAVTFIFVSTEECKSMDNILKVRDVKPVKGTFKLHVVSGIGKSEVFVLNDILLTSYSFVGHSFCCTTEAIAWPFPVANFKIISTSPNTIQLPVVCYCKETLAIAILAGWSICPIVNK
jgi:hypothetical protein